MNNRALLLALVLPMLIPLAACRDDEAGPLPLKADCASCGVVESIVTREVKGEGTGKGAVARAIVGGVVGHQFGSGKGNDAATVVGAGAGAIAGHEAEKEMNKRLVYEVTVRMEKDGVRRASAGRTGAWRLASKPAASDCV
jgi:outer membrane lipoprotein SlyB